MNPNPRRQFIVTLAWSFLVGFVVLKFSMTESVSYTAYAAVAGMFFVLRQRHEHVVEYLPSFAVNLLGFTLGTSAAGLLMLWLISHGNVQISNIDFLVFPLLSVPVMAAGLCAILLVMLATRAGIPPNPLNVTPNVRKGMLTALAIGPLYLLLHGFVAVRVWQFGPSWMLLFFEAVVLGCFSWLFFLFFPQEKPTRAIIKPALAATLCAILLIEGYAAAQELSVWRRCQKDCGQGISEPRWPPFETSALGCTPESGCWGTD